MDELWAVWPQNQCPTTDLVFEEDTYLKGVTSSITILREIAGSYMWVQHLVLAESHKNTTLPYENSYWNVEFRECVITNTSTL